MPLQYSNPLEAQGRPGLITAVGVISIVVACLNGLGNLSGTLSAAMFLVSSQMTSLAAPRSTVTATSATTTPTTAPGTTVTTAGSSTVVVTTSATSNPFGDIDPAALGLSLATSLLGLGLAVLLLVAGILILRDSRHAVRMHWWYVGLKIPLVIAATLAAVWMWQGLMRSMLGAMPPSAPAAPFQSWMMHISTLIGAVMALAYPVALMFLLRSRTVRDYFSEIHTLSPAAAALTP
jgi:hypothetical protein